MKNRYWSLGLSLILVGCSSLEIRTIPPGPVISEKVVLKDYIVGKIKTVSTGSVMLQKKEGVKRYFLTVKSSTKVPANLPYQDFEYFLGYQKFPNMYFNSPWCIDNLGFADAIKSYMEGKGECVVHRIAVMNYNAYGFYAQASEPVPASDLKLEEGVAETNGFMCELLYNGKQGDGTLKIGYREFEQNFARPAFYQDLSYNLNESKIISFKNYVIEVVEATNNSISFTVKQE